MHLPKQQRGTHQTWRGSLSIQPKSFSALRTCPYFPQHQYGALTRNIRQFDPCRSSCASQCHTLRRRCTFSLEALPARSSGNASQLECFRVFLSFLIRKQVRKLWWLCRSSNLIFLQWKGNWILQVVFRDATDRSCGCQTSQLPL